jgi:prepilin-type processing-associated H-X9-DG protein
VAQRPFDAPARFGDRRITRNATDFALLGESTHPSQLLPWWNAMNPYTYYHLALRNYAFLDGHVEGSKMYTTKYAIYIMNDGTVYRARNNHAGTPPYEY